MKYVKTRVGIPDNSAFIRKLIIYCIIMGVMLFGAGSIFDSLMSPIGRDGLLDSWYVFIVPFVACMMLISLFRAYRRRWPMAFMMHYKSQARDNGYTICPRCGARLEERSKGGSYRAKVGERVTTTTYSDGSRSTRTEDITQNRSYREIYHQCTNSSCALIVEQQLGQSHYPWKKKEIRALVLDDKSGFSKKRNDAHSLLLSRLLLPFLALIIIIAGVFSVYNYIDDEYNVLYYTVADKEASVSLEEYEKFLMSLDTDNKYWEVSFTKKKTDFISYLKSFSLYSYTIKGQTHDGISTYWFDFHGESLGTGLPDGEYILTELDGEAVLIDGSTNTIYRADTEFYKANADKLKALTFDKFMLEALAAVEGGEHAVFTSGASPTEFIKSENAILYSPLPSSEKSEYGSMACAMVNFPDKLERDQYYFEYSDKKELIDLEGYTYFDAAVSNPTDPLAKLLANAEGSSYYSYFVNDEEIIDVCIDTLANGYQFEMDLAYENFEEGAIYKLNTNTKTMSKITYDEHYQAVETPLPMSEHQKDYDFLLSLEPKSYLLKNFDISNAEKSTSILGQYRYTWKDENGKTIAELKVKSGAAYEFVHYISDTERIELTF